MFLLVKSSAGSGKTFTLVKEYLKLCLKEPALYPHILAITFTNKAAAEMKIRIIDSLQQFLTEGRNAIVDQVLEETGLDFDQAAQNAQKLQTSILHVYSDFSVMTIDSFISRIVRTFARDLDMPLKFDVELDTHRITTEVIDLLMAGAEPGQFLGDVLTEFALSKINTTGSWNLDGELAKLGEIAFNEKYIEAVSFIGQPVFDEPFWREMIHDIETIIKNFRHEINHRAREALGLINQHGLEITDFSFGKKGAAGALEKYARAGNIKDFDISKRMENGEWAAKRKGPELAARIQQVLDAGLKRLSNEILTLIGEGMPGFISHVLVQKNIYAEALIHQFLAMTETYKMEKNCVPLTDFSRKVSDVIVHEPIPFLYWRLGNQYHHILIDEFQDTSLLQWTNLLPLIEESLAKGQFSMAVGDAKQAIYRWRAGDMRIMEELLPQALGDHVSESRLNANYRSRKEIVNFNNQFFECLPHLFSFKVDDLPGKLYNSEESVQLPISDRTGFVQIRSVDMPDAGRKTDKQIRLLETMVEDLHQILQEGHGYSCQDVAVLVRNNSEAGLAARILFEAGLNVVSPDSLRLNSSEAVRFVICALRYAVYEDRISLFFLWLSGNRDVHVFDCWSREPGGLKKIERTLSETFSKRKRFLLQLPVYEAAEEVIDIFQLNRTHHGFLQGLLEVLLNYSDQYNSDISGFLDWWDTHKNTDQATLPGSGSANAVTLTTIHKAKGLEFPIVMMPFAWDIVDKANKDNFLWVQSHQIGSQNRPYVYMADVQQALEQSWFAEIYAQEQKLSLLDNVNLLYVALTRAADRLYLYIPPAPAEERDPENTADLIRVSLSHIPMQQHEDTWRLGHPGEKVIQKPEEGQGSEMIRELSSHAWRHKITVKKRARELWRLDESELTARVDRGNLIHEILAQVLIPDDIPAAIDAQVREGNVHSGDAVSLEKSIRLLLTIPVENGTVADWFRPGLKIRNESTIAAPGLNYRPDRVILEKNKAIVVDYKTGQKMASHREQILTYGRLLKEMGYDPVEMVLLYIETGEAEVVWNS